MQPSTENLSIAVISDRSLLAGGIACKLMEFANTSHLNIVDIKSPDIRQILQAQSPTVIILDSGDPNIGQTFSLRELFQWVPQAKIICLDASSDSAHVFTSREVHVDSAEQLLHILEPGGSNQ